MARFTKNIALTTALLYALFAGVWILLSDYVLAWLSYSAQTVALFSLFKGLAFVVVTAIVLYLLLRKYNALSGDSVAFAKLSTLTRQTKILFATLGLILFAIPLFSAGVLYQRAPMVEAQAHKMLSMQAQLKAQHLQSWLLERSADAQTLDQDRFLIRRLSDWLQGDADAEQEVEQLLTQRMQAYAYEAIELFDGDKPIMRIGRLYDTAHMHLKDLINQAWLSGRMQTSNLYHDESGHLHMDWIVPLEMPTHQITLVLHAGPEGFLTSTLGDLLHNIEYKTYIVVGLNQAKPNVFSVSEPGLVEAVECQNWHWLTAVRTQAFGGFSANNCAADKVAFGFYALPERDWAVMTQQSLREAFAPLRAMTFWLTFISIILVVLLTLVLWLLWRQEQRVRALVVSTETAEKEALLDYVAHYDSITGLPNRALFLEQLAHKIKEALHSRQDFALLIFDLDRFKDINDSYGHQIGDVLLRSVGDSLHREVDESVSLSRIGGDEFALIVHGESSNHQLVQLATEQAIKVAEVLNRPMKLRQDLSVRVGVSIGICLFPYHAQTADRLMQFADAALYRAKAEGKGRFAFYSDELTALARERVRQEANLKQAIFKQHLVLFYQPQVDVATQKIVSAEALIRWQDPKLGLIAPTEFIPMAEETGLIKEIGDWVVQQVCQQGQAWLNAGYAPLRLAVNVSAQQFHHGQIIDTVKRALSTTGFPPAYLEIELTESALMQSSDSIGETLDALRALGVSIALDDFGTGYSSLSYLKRFKLDLVKIDKSFIDGIVDSPRDAQLVQAIIDMAHALGLNVLAEGVETHPQFKLLQQQNCDLYQGYLISQALPAEKFIQLYVGA